MGNLASKFLGLQVAREDPRHPPMAFDQQNVRYPVAVDIEEAPQPIPSTAFYRVGRDAQHATPTMWRYQQFAIPEWLSVMGWPFIFGKVPSALVVSTPRGKQNPIVSRVNIESPPPTALGSLTTLGGVQASAPRYAKITY